MRKFLICSLLGLGLAGFTVGCDKGDTPAPVDPDKVTDVVDDAADKAAGDADKAADKAPESDKK
jgi:hypothetical protein